MQMHVLRNITHQVNRKQSAEIIDATVTATIFHIENLRNREEVELLNGKAINLRSQVDALFNHCNQKSIQTRYRYRAAEYRFIEWLGDNTNIKKIKNIKCRHLYQYVDHLKDSGSAPGYIKGELSGIRFFHYLTGSREQLPENDKFNIDKRLFARMHRAWSDSEYSAALKIAEEMGRIDVIMSLMVSRYFGLRLEEAITLRMHQIKQALHFRELVVYNTKGKYPRCIPVEDPEQQHALEYILKHCKNREKVFIGPGDYTHKVKKSIQDWIRNHREEFQDPGRVSNDEARQLVMNDDMMIPNTHLTIHGCRHAYAQDNYNNKIDEAEDDYQAKKDTSIKLGHHRTDVVNIYLK